MTKLNVDAIENVAGTAKPTLTAQYPLEAIIHYDMRTSNTTRRSQNVTSFTDNGTGSSLINFTNVFNNIWYAAGANAQKYDASDDGNTIIQIGGNTTNVRTTSTDRVLHKVRSGTSIDMDLNQYMSQGVLA